MAYFRAYNMICKQESIGDYVKYSRASVSAKFTLRALQEKGKKDTIASLKQGAPILPNKNIENLTKQHVVLKSSEHVWWPFEKTSGFEVVGCRLVVV